MSISKSVLQNYLKKHAYLSDQETLSSDTALFSTGLFDSFHLVELVGFIESEANIKISPMEVTLHNLDSIDQILDFVERKSGKLNQTNSSSVDVA